LQAGSRYEASGEEAEFEPGSRRRVLRNLIGVRSAREMARRESEALLVATQRVIDETGVDQQFTAADLCHMHHVWLGAIYAWAGAYRQVNIGKDGFMFAAAKQVPQLIQEFARGPLTQFTPCHFEDAHSQAHAMGVVHAELVLIHPFREGNGRCARLMATLMGLQAGLPALDFGGIRGAEKRHYILAIQAAMGRDYAPIDTIFRAVIARTLRSQATVSSA